MSDRSNEAPIIIATHKEDIDGIVSAALLLKVFPHATIVFTTPREIMRLRSPFFIVVDLPKPRNCQINIDHHRSNYSRLTANNLLTDRDLVDPSAPSAASLVAKYFRLDDPLSNELVDFANLADTGHINREIMMLDVVIKENQNSPQILYQLAYNLSRHGLKYLSSEEFQQILSNYKHIFELREKIESALQEILKGNTKYVVFDTRKLPYSLAKYPATAFVRRSGLLGVAIYIDPDSGNTRVSLRSSEEFPYDLNNFAEKYGGGGHRHAAGFILKNPSHIAKLIRDLESTFNLKQIVYVKI